jgi:ABC-type phosphate/phosphonate transport system ATPase subunit
MLVRRIHEMHGAENVAVIGHGHSGHAKLLHVLAELFDVTSAIEERIVGVQVQVNELGHGLRLV